MILRVSGLEFGSGLRCGEGLHIKVFEVLIDLVYRFNGLMVFESG